MSAKENGNSPAVPMMVKGNFTDEQATGMTKRETIAMHLMASVAATPDGTVQGNARFAVFAADALLAELAKEPT